VTDRAPEPRFVQIHTLTAYPGSLLNRDDVGLAKRVPFGGHSRIRVSSQCLKRHWRTAEGAWALKNLGVPMTVRSREIFELKIAQPLIRDGLDAGVVRAVVKALQAVFLGKSKKKDTAEKAAGEGKKEKKDDQGDLKTAQVIALGQPEIDYLKKVAERIASETKVADAAKAVDALDKELRENLKAMRKATAGLDGAMFGRMVTSDILARTDAAVHVAHAFSVHAEEAENDYFTAVDDLVRERDELGSGHLGDAELTSGVFYGYVVVDVPQLVGNLEGVERSEWTTADRTLAGRAVENLLHLIATVSPGAKRGSTAPYAYAQLMLVELGDRQPRSLANAFLRPVELDGRPGVLCAAVKAMGRHLADFDGMYGAAEERRICAMTDVTDIAVGKAASLDELAKWVRSRLTEA